METAVSAVVPAEIREHVVKEGRLACIRACLQPLVARSGGSCYARSEEEVVLLIKTISDCRLGNERKVALVKMGMTFLRNTCLEMVRIPIETTKTTTGASRGDTHSCKPPLGLFPLCGGPKLEGFERVVQFLLDFQVSCEP